MRQYRAVVMAGGEGSRLRPLTVHRPKPLAPVANRPIMEHILLLIKKHGIEDVVATLHYLADEIQAYFGDGSEWGLRLVHSTEPQPLGTAGSVKHAESHLGGHPFVIVSGDALTDCDLRRAMAFHESRGAQATIVLKRTPNPLEFGIVITDGDGRVERFLEKPGWSEVFSDTVNTGIYILEPEVLARMEPGRSYDWSQDIFPAMLAEGSPIFGYVMEEYWSDVGNLTQLREAQSDLLNGLVDLEIPGHLVSPGIYRGAETVIEEGATLIAPLCIGEDCRIKSGAILGPGTVIGDGCIVDSDARIEQSVVMDSCYIGANAELTGTLVCPRCTIKRESRLNEDSVIGDRCLIDVGATVRPSVKIWPDKVVDRGATVTVSLVTGSKWRGSLFREFGVAGLSNLEITPEFATRFGLAVGSALPAHRSIITARDSTRSSRMTKRSIIASLLSTGHTVIDMRSSPVPITRHYVRASGAAGAVMVRKAPGSTRMTMMELYTESGGYANQALQRKIESSFFREEFRRIDSEELGVIDLASRSVELYTQDFFACLPVQTLARKPRIVIDYGYSSVSPIYPAILSQLGVEAISLNAVNNAKLAPRTPDQIQRHLQNLAQIVGSLNCELGVLMINEGERLALVDELGLPLTGLNLLGACASVVALTSPGQKVVLKVTAPDRLQSWLERQGAEVVRSRASVRHLMADSQGQGVAFAGDDEGGFIFPQLTTGFDAMFALASLLVRLESLGRKIGEIARELPEVMLVQSTVGCSPESKGRVMRGLAEAEDFQGRVELLDGIKIYFDGAWVLVLPDSFEPEIHVYSEADTRAAAESLAQEMVERIERLKALES